MRKVGRLIHTDLRHLQTECRSSASFAGALDLARLAKDRQIVSSAQASLSELCATVLHRRLNKAVPERVSTAWENHELTKEQLSYAALDAYACLRIYEELAKVSVPGPLPSKATLIPSLPVLLYHADNTRVIASGTVSTRAADARYDNINITPTRTVMTVEEVLIPGALVTTHHNRALRLFGPPPFDVVCLRSHLRTKPMRPDAVPSVKVPESPRPQLPSVPLRSSLEPPNQAPSGMSFDSDSEDSNPVMPISNEGSSDTSSIAAALYDQEGPDDPSGNGSEELSLESAPTHPRDPQDLSNYERDAAGDIHARELEASSQESIISGWEAPIRSRVLKDAWHVFNMLYISRVHGLRYAFANALRDAIFVPDKQDKENITRYLSTLPAPRNSWDYMVRTAPRWVWRHCKRLIPPPELLYPHVSRVFQTYGPLKDAKTGQPLFNTAAWHTAKNILALIQNGYVSDPPGIALYYIIGIDQKAGYLPLYRCMRGTNWTEGGVHRHLRTHLPTSGTSPRHMLCCLYEFILRHNLLVSDH